MLLLLAFTLWLSSGVIIVALIWLFVIRADRSKPGEPPPPSGGGKLPQPRRA